MFKDTRAFSSHSVDDLDKAKQFYGQTLGLPIEESPEGIYVNLSGGGKLFMYPKPNHTPASFTVLNFLIDNIDQTVDSLVAAGVSFEHYDGPSQTDAKGIVRGDGTHPGPAAIAWFKDPAGNIISVIQEKA